MTKRPGYLRALSAYSHFGAADAHDDARASLTQQLLDLERTTKEKSTTQEAARLEAERIKLDLAQYNPWSSSWTPVSMGGYYSFDEIRKRIDVVIASLPPLTDLAKVVIAKTPLPAKMEQDACKAAAEKLFGASAPFVPGAEKIACNIKLITTIGVLLVIVAMLIVLRPYVSLGSALLRKRPRKNS